MSGFFYFNDVPTDDFHVTVQLRKLVAGSHDEIVDEIRFVNVNTSHEDENLREVREELRKRNGIEENQIKK